MYDFIGIYDDLVSEDYCDRMIDKLEELLTTGSGNDYGQDSNGGLKNRKDASRYFNNEAKDLSRETFLILDMALDKYVDEYPALGMHDVRANVCKVQKTPPRGGFHVWHSEQSVEGEQATRCLVWMIYLNNTKEHEGTTEFISQGKAIQPKKGRIVLFPAAWTHTHRGNPVYSTDKYIATGWYHLT